MPALGTQRPEMMGVSASEVEVERCGTGNGNEKGSGSLYERATTKQYGSLGFRVRSQRRLGNRETCK